MRFRLAEKLFKNDSSLGNVAETITDMVNFAKAVGVPETIKAAPGTILATGTTRLSASDNDCTHCSLFGCKARNDIKKCPIMNKAVPIGPGTAFPRDAQVRYIDGGRNKLVEEAQAAQVQPEVPLLFESASMNTIKLAAPMNVSRKITLKITDAHRTVMFHTSSGIPDECHALRQRCNSQLHQDRCGPTGWQLHREC